MLPAIAMLAFVGTSCNDDDEGARIEPPTIKVGEISLESETSSNVVVTVTPSENTETCIGNVKKQEEKQILMFQ